MVSPGGQLKVKEIPSSWMGLNGRRLDCGPYMSGAVEAKLRLGELSCRKDRLADLTAGHSGGIYNGPQFSRTFVDSPDYGVPFLGTSSMLQADLNNLPLLSKKDAYSKKLAHLRLSVGTTLISCSGTIGRMVYVRPDMEGMWTSQHIMKVVPDPEKIPPGYLYAFLSSKFGVPIVTSGTYGAIIQHIEPQHIAALPVPRLGKDVECEVHRLVEQSAKLRTGAASSLLAIAKLFDTKLPTGQKACTSPRVSKISALKIQKRFDAQFHDPLTQAIRDNISKGPYETIGKYCSGIKLPGIFKRLYANDSAHGVPYFTGASLFHLEPSSKGLLSRRTALFDEVLLTKNTVLVQAFGQDGGLTGKAVWIGEHLDGTTSTHMLCRLKTPEPIRTAYLFGFLRSELAYQQIKRLTFGGSIPHFDESGIGDVLIPLLDGESGIANIGAVVLAAVGDRDKALACERLARGLVERKIEGMT